jgi:hypothetical protein
MMMKIPFALDGTWWLPQFPNQRVQGKLAFSLEEGAVLEAYEHFPDPLMAELVKIPLHPYTPSMIVGMIQGERPCTLINNLATDLGRRPRFVSQYVLMGGHFQSTEDIAFRSVSFRLQHLEEWTGISPLETPDRHDPFLLRPRRIDSPLHPPPLFETSFAEPNPAHASVVSYFNPVFGISRFSLEHVARVRVNFSRPVGLVESIQLVHDCRNFFSLLIGRDTPPFEVHVSGNDLDCTDVATRSAQLFYSGIGSPIDKEIHPSEMLLAMPSLSNVAEAFSNWLNRANALRLGVNWLLGTSRVRGYLETDFIACTQAVEALHRLTKSTHFVPSSEHEALEKALLSAIPTSVNKDYRQKLESAIHYANELSLRRRLRDMIGGRPGEFGLENASAFINKVVHTRIFLIHNDPVGAADAASGEDLFKLSIQLRSIVTVYLLTLIDIPRDIAVRSVLGQQCTY